MLLDAKETVGKEAAALAFEGRDIVAIDELSKDEIAYILDMAAERKAHPAGNPLEGCLLGSCFFEPSTRTRLSFESAMYRLGGRVMGFSDGAMLSLKKGESLADTMRMIENYVDLIVIRHPLEGAARLAAETVGIPVINAGDGANQHPTQTLIDLFTIREGQGTLENLSIAMVGDLKYGRTAHSLAQAAVHFGFRLYFVSPPTLEMPREVCTFLRENSIKFSFHRHIDEVLPKVDVLYMTRMQKERETDALSERKEHSYFCLHAGQLERARQNLNILHPLPRNDEVDRSVDATSFACYFRQASNGLYVRQALLQLVLGK